VPTAGFHQSYRSPLPQGWPPVRSVEKFQEPLAKVPAANGSCCWLIPSTSGQKRYQINVQKHRSTGRRGALTRRSQQKVQYLSSKWSLSNHSALTLNQRKQ